LTAARRRRQGQGTPPRAVGRHRPAGVDRLGWVSPNGQRLPLLSNRICFHKTPDLRAMCLFHRLVHFRQFPAFHTYVQGQGLSKLHVLSVDIRLDPSGNGLTVETKPAGLLACYDGPQPLGGVPAVGAINKGNAMAPANRCCFIATFLPARTARSYRLD
jgi:hypothetical protein